MYISKILLIIAIFSGALFQTQAANHSVVVAYIDGDKLYTWRESTGESQSIASGNVAHPVLSPDAGHLLFLIQSYLWTANLNISGNPLSALVSLDQINIAPDKSRFILNYAWLDNKTVIFNTYHFKPNELVQQQFADDLWQVDLDSDKVTRLLADGDGGNFSISPDAKHIAVVRPGDYAKNIPGAITVVDADGKNAVKLMEFPVVNTGASYQFYPQVTWTPDNASLLVAIPDPNLIYATGKVPSTALWKLDLSGTKTQIGSVQADFFGLPQFSSDGKYILYAQRIGAVKDNEIAVFQANSDGTDQQEIVRDTIGTLEPARWSPTGSAYTFVHGKPGEVWLAKVNDRNPNRVPNAATLAFNLVWADATTYVYETSTGGAGEIQYSDSTIHTIAKCSACGELDARR